MCHMLGRIMVLGKFEAKFLSIYASQNYLNPTTDWYLSIGKPTSSQNMPQ